MYRWCDSIGQSKQRCPIKYGVLLSVNFTLSRADRNQPITRKVTICGWNEKLTELDLKLCASRLEQWALCSWWSHATKTAILESKLRTGTSKTKHLNFNFFVLFCMSQCVICSPVWRFLYHVIVGCKGLVKAKFHVYLSKASTGTWCDWNPIR